MKNKEFISYIAILLIGIFYIFPFFSKTNNLPENLKKESYIQSIQVNSHILNPDLVNFPGYFKNYFYSFIFSDPHNISKTPILFFPIEVLIISILTFVNISLLKEKINLRLRI